MGTWATRSRRGGGPSAAAALIFITDAHPFAFGISLLTYSAPIDADDFNATDFFETSTNSLADSVGQATPDSLTVTWGEDFGPGSVIVYSGSVPGVLTPQAIPNV